MAAEAGCELDGVARMGDAGWPAKRAGPAVVVVGDDEVLSRARPSSESRAGVNRLSSVSGRGRRAEITMASKTGDQGSSCERLLVVPR